jgi:predicted nucleotidyltransferase
MRKELQNKLKGLQVSVVYLFGSAAIGRRTRSSDIDIGVVFKELRPGEDTRTLYNVLYGIFSELYRASKIDIVFLQKAPLSLQYSALKEGKVLFEENPFFTADYEHGVINQYLDFKPVLDFFDRSMVERHAKA